MEINLTERERYMRIREGILLKNIFNFVLFQCEKSSTKERFLVFGTSFSLSLSVLMM